MLPGFPALARSAPVITASAFDPTGIVHHLSNGDVSYIDVFVSAEVYEDGQPVGSNATYDWGETSGANPVFAGYRDKSTALVRIYDFTRGDGLRRENVFTCAMTYRGITYTAQVVLTLEWL